MITPDEVITHIAKGFLTEVQGSLGASVNLMTQQGGSREEVAAIVMGAPAYFGHGRKEALKDCIIMAGAPKARLSETAEEPVLALLGAMRSPQGSTLRSEMDAIVAKIKADETQFIMVIDIGGGTTDMTVCEISRRRLGSCLQVSVIDIGGMDNLAGKDFKEKIREVRAGSR